MNDMILIWLANGRVGASSKAMAFAVAEIDSKEKDHPRDPSDLSRCLLFLDAVPEARQHLNKIAVLTDYWKALIDRFEEVETCFLNEVGLHWEKADEAPQTYELMRSIIEPIESKDHSIIRFGSMSFKSG